MENNMRNIIFAGIASLVLFITLDIALGSTNTVKGIVLDKAFTPSSSSIGTGVSSSGAIVTTTEDTYEKWTLILKLEDGSIVSNEADNAVFYSVDSGDAVSVKIRTFYFTKATYRFKITK